MQLFKRNVSPHELILFAAEIVLICGAMAVAFHLHGTPDSAIPWRILPAAARSGRRSRFSREFRRRRLKKL